jgi:hypothetical protein
MSVAMQVWWAKGMPKINELFSDLTVKNCLLRLLSPEIRATIFKNGSPLFAHALWPASIPLSFARCIGWIYDAPMLCARHGRPSRD